MGKFIITEEEKNRIKSLYEQATTGTTTGQTTPNKDTEIKNLGLSSVDVAFKKYGFERNDNPPVIRSPYQYVVTYDKKPFYSGNITEDGNAGVKILVKTPIKDIALAKCKSKTHDLDQNYILLNKNNADCILGRLTYQITD